MRSLVKPFVFCALLGLLAGAVPARAAESDFQVWSPLILQGDLSKRWRGYFELQPRFGAKATELDRFIVRPAVGYRLNRHVSVWLGYLWTPIPEPEFSNEHRIFQQLLAEHRAGKLSITNRTRLEQRMLEDADGTSLRLRHMLRLAYPIDPKKKWAVVLYDELFWNLNTVRSGPESGFDQNRIFLGLSRTVNQSVRLEGGYLWNFINQTGTRPNRNNDVLVLSLIYTWR